MQGSGLTTGSNPPFPITNITHKSSKLCSTPLGSELYRNNLSFSLETDTGEIMPWTPLSLCLLSDCSDLKKHKRQTILKSCG